MARQQDRQNIDQRTDKLFEDLRSNILDGLRQLTYPAEWRIELPIPSESTEESQEAEASRETEAEWLKATATARLLSARMIAEVATCLWDIERKLRPVEGEEQERRHRLAYRRTTKAIDALKEGGIEIKDPTGERYPQGGENWMKPIQLQPTPGLTFERVTETVAPIVYSNNSLIQRGEVFVAVPMETKPPARDEQSSDVVADSGCGASLNGGNGAPATGTHEATGSKVAEDQSLMPEDCHPKMDEIPEPDLAISPETVGKEKTEVSGWNAETHEEHAPAARAGATEPEESEGPEDTGGEGLTKKH